MTQLQELRKEAKEKGLKGYSTMGVSDLQLLLAGKRVPKKTAEKSSQRGNTD